MILDYTFVGSGGEGSLHVGIAGDSHIWQWQSRRVRKERFCTGRGNTPRLRCERGEELALERMGAVVGQFAGAARAA